jgi:hypothetical protein
VSLSLGRKTTPRKPYGDLEQVVDWADLYVRVNQSVFRVPPRRDVLRR